MCNVFYKATIIFPPHLLLVLIALPAQYRRDSDICSFLPLPLVGPDNSHHSYKRKDMIGIIGPITSNVFAFILY